MMRWCVLFLVLIGCFQFSSKAIADTTVGEFESLSHEQRVSCLTKLTNDTLDKIVAKDPVLALKIQEYFIIPPTGQKYGIGAMAFEQQIDAYDAIDPKGYTIENAFAKVLSDYLAKSAQSTTSPSTTKPL